MSKNRWVFHMEKDENGQLLLWLKANYTVVIASILGSIFALAKFLGY